MTWRTVVVATGTFVVLSGAVEIGCGGVGSGGGSQPNPSAPTDTVTPAPTDTVTPVPLSNQSVCGGPVTSVPKICNATVSPHGGTAQDPITVTYQMSDLENDVDQVCVMVEVLGAPLGSTCQSFSTVGSSINGTFETDPIHVGTNGVITGYMLQLVAHDVMGNQSNVAQISFQCCSTFPPSTPSPGVACGPSGTGCFLDTDCCSSVCNTFIGICQ